MQPASARGPSAAIANAASGQAGDSRIEDP